jgi:hypothetical protein
VRTLEAECLEEAEKDCSKGLGSRSKLLLSGRGGGLRIGCAWFVVEGGLVPLRAVGGVGPVMVTTLSAGEPALLTVSLEEACAPSGVGSAESWTGERMD